MDVELARDWMIIICLGIGSVAICVALVFLIIIATKVVSILDSTKEALDNVRNTSSAISRTMISPLSKAQGLFGGVRKIVELVLSLKGKEGKKDEQ